MTKWHHPDVYLQVRESSEIDVKLSYNDRRGYHFVVPMGQRDLASDLGFIQARPMHRCVLITCSNISQVAVTDPAHVEEERDVLDRDSLAAQPAVPRDDPPDTHAH